jgi:hypothetical protein
MAVTPNYSWPVPVATDFVKDGWEAISDLGNAIDTTVSGLGGGLTLIKSETIGSAVSSVQVTGAFSATYDNYKIILSGTIGSTSSNITMILGASTSNYETSQISADTRSSTLTNVHSGASQTSWRIATNGFHGAGAPAYTNIANLDIYAPFATGTTYYAGWTQNFGSTGYQIWSSGYQSTAASYTSFTISPSTGTITGGTIKVYGYQK